MDLSRMPALVGISSIALALAATTAVHAGNPCNDCPADLDTSGVVDGADITIILGSWGNWFGGGDANGDFQVDGADIAIVLGAWGPCPPPGNDACANATLIVEPHGSQILHFCNTLATSSGPMLPAGACDGGPALQIYNDVWFQFAPLSDGVVQVNTCADNLWWDPVIAVYGATIPGLAVCPTGGIGLSTLVDCDDDTNSFGCELDDAFASFGVKAGYVYKIRVGAITEGFGSEGAINFDFDQYGFDCDFPVAASNAQGISEVVGTTVDNEVSDVPATCFNGQPQGPTEWIKYTANCNATLVISTCHPNTDFDTVLNVLTMDNWSNLCGEQFIGCNDDSNAPGCSLGGVNRKSRLEIEVANGDEILIAVSGYGGASGNYGLTITRVCD